jgi:hypothetical protein
MTMRTVTMYECQNAHKGKQVESENDGPYANQKKWQITRLEGMHEATSFSGVPYPPGIRYACDLCNFAMV